MTTEASSTSAAPLPDDTAPPSDSTLAPTLAALTVVGVASAIGLVLSVVTIATGDAEEAGRLGFGIGGVVLGAIGLTAAARLVRRVIRLREERLTLPFQYEMLRSKLVAEPERGKDVAARYEEEAEALYARLTAAGMASEARDLAHWVVALRHARGESSGGGGVKAG